MDEVKTGDWRLTVFWIAMALATGIAGFVLGWSWRDRPGALANVSLLNVMTAFGTVGATVAAVGIAAWQYASAKRDRYLEAVHTVAEAYPRFLALAAALQIAKELFESDGVTRASNEDLQECISMVRREYLEADLPTPALLIPLAGTHSRDLAAVVSHLGPVFRLAEKDSMPTEDDRQETVQLLLNAMGVAIPRLNSLGDHGYEWMMRPSGR